MRWTCHICGSNNYPERSSCYRCHREKGAQGGKKTTGQICQLYTRVNYQGNRGGRHHSIATSQFNRGERLSNNYNHANYQRNEGRDKSPFFRKYCSNKEFLKSLENVLKSPKLTCNKITSYASIWSESWTDYKALDDVELKTLLTSFAILPRSFEVPQLPSLQCCHAAIERFLIQSGDILSKIELVLNLVQRMKLDKWSEESTENVRNSLIKILTACNKSLDLKILDHIHVIDKIKTVILELRKPGAIKMTESEEVVKYSKWEQAPLKWLADTKNFQPYYLPKMKVPGSASMGVYDNKEDYFNTIEKLWIGLTFCDGNSVFNPKCRFMSKPGSECGQVLVPVNDKKSTMKCSTCETMHVMLQCPFHREVLECCLNCVQGNLMGPPGIYASTNIYDCQVAAINYNGSIFMKNLKSRRPPFRIHWKTTRRLVSSNLVGLVKLPPERYSLSDTDTVVWAEVGNHDKPQEEFRQHELGNIVVSLIGITMCGNFQTGDHIALIDCFTFVPEHLPILNAIEMQKQSSLPFQEGALLNLRRLPKNRETKCVKVSEDSCDSSSDCSEVCEDIPKEDDHEGLMGNISSQIDKMIEKSELEPIVQIRRKKRTTAELKMQLSQLISETTLDSQQLESFLEALYYPVHLTQGPPGTGKSYFGVVLVRALLLICQKWMKVCPSIGQPPILVLSYKNHAIDEFLSDLVSQETDVSMIRMGSTDHPGIDEKYFENSNYGYYRETNIKKRNLENITSRKSELQLKSTPYFYFEKVLSNSHDKKFKETSDNATKYFGCLITFVKYMQGFFSEEGEKKPQTNKIVFNSNSKFEIKYHDIQGLYEGVKHYNYEDMEQIFRKWVTGFEPKKKCSHCQHFVRSSTHKFCKIHACSFRLDTSEHCLFAKKDGHNFCESHSCRVDSCTSVKKPSEQIYCEDHICFVCAKENIVASRATDEPPRNTCSKHILCHRQFCLNLKLPNVRFCEDHNKAARCNAVTNEIQCEGFVVSRGKLYCTKHLQKIEPESTFASEKSHGKKARSAKAERQFCLTTRDCKGLNKHKKHCGTKARAGYDYCKDHINKYQAKLIYGNEVTHTDDTEIDPEQELQEKTCSRKRLLNTATNESENTFISEKSNGGKASSAKVEPEFECCLTTRNCKGLNKNKKPCKSEPQAGYDYCKDHTNKYQAKLIHHNEVGNQSFTSKGNAETSESLKNLKSLETGQKSDSSVTGMFLQPPLPDENLERIDDEDDFFIENDQLQYILDVDNIDEQAPVVWVEDDTEDLADEVLVEDEVIPPHMWTWTMSVEKRWEQCRLLERQYISLFNRVIQDYKRDIEIARKEYHDATVKAKSMVYEGKSVIGGTIVGCIKRLDAIRNLKPFAVIVEEASEVLEPLLFSCFTPSTCKLEMIGDHYQLQPSVMSKIVFERYNCINISMFERLINAPNSHKVPSTALATQRRMRKNICDFTRHFYERIVEIIDHEVCSSKKIGDSLSPASDLRRLRMCMGGGREVPGLLPNVFFWTHNHQQTKAEVGLSRVNVDECERVVGLTKYLVSCGVPKPSIAVLTPYKGQLMLLRKRFINISFIDTSNRSNSMRVSTVDCFQGDEADIVIISLVIDANSHTPFVKKVNRMIVLLSRARLGMYIVGNIRYFEEKRDLSITHWNQTLEKLREPGVQDTSETLVAENTESLIFNGPRCGDQLPICCPIHRDNFVMADSVSKLAVIFCKEKCSFKLSCSHACDLPCHFSQPDRHNKSCQVVIDPPPCPRHKVSVTCFNFYMNFQADLWYKRPDINGILEKYRCLELVDIKLPCTHETEVSCADESDIQRGLKSFPKCMEICSLPHSNPQCGHNIQVPCYKWQICMDDPLQIPKCQEKVSYIPPCSHKVQMDCWVKVKHDDQEEVFSCLKNVKAQLPCGHMKKMKCADESAIKKGLKSFPVCKELPIVPYTCQQCGHHKQVLCYQWHKYMDDPSLVPKCQER